MRKTSLWRGLFTTLFVVATAVYCVTYPARSWYSSRSVLAQRVEVNATDALLLGSSNRPIGSPQRMIVTDPKAYLAGEGPGGARLVDEGYLRTHGEYPLQLKTVDFFVRAVRWGCAVAMVVALWGWLQFRGPRMASGGVAGSPTIS